MEGTLSCRSELVLQARLWRPFGFDSKDRRQSRSVTALEGLDTIDQAWRTPLFRVLVFNRQDTEATETHGET